MTPTQKSDSRSVQINIVTVKNQAPLSPRTPTVKAIDVLDCACTLCIPIDLSLLLYYDVRSVNAAYSAVKDALEGRLVDSYS